MYSKTQVENCRMMALKFLKENWFQHHKNISQPRALVNSRSAGTAPPLWTASELSTKTARCAKHEWLGYVYIIIYLPLNAWKSTQILKNGNARIEKQIFASCRLIFFVEQSSSLLNLPVNSQTSPAESIWYHAPFQIPVGFQRGHESNS